MRTLIIAIVLIVFGLAGALPSQAADAASGQKSPDYARDIAPILRKYCAGCHNAEEANGELRLDAYAEILKGGENGPALADGDAKVSRMLRLVTGDTEPQMPPEDEKQPTEAEVAMLITWINAGAKDPEGAEPTPRLITPQIAAAKVKAQPITSIAYSPDGKLVAVARFRNLEIRSEPEGSSRQNQRRGVQPRRPAAAGGDRRRRLVWASHGVGPGA